MAAANGSVRVSGSRLRLFQAAAIALGVCVGFAIMEVSLRPWPGLLGQDFVNGVRSKYRTGPGGIFYRDNRLGIHFMIPNYRTEMYYNNYVWTHETDALGFRNRAVSIPADVMHGVTKNACVIRPVAWMTCGGCPAEQRMLELS